MSEELKSCRLEFEAAIVASGVVRPGNYNPEYDRYVSERIQGRYEGWKLARATHPAQESVGGVEVEPVRWTGNPDADLALILLGRIDASEDESRIEQLEQIVMRLGKAATVPAGSRVVPVELLESLVHYLECSANLTEKDYGDESYEHARNLRALLEVKK